MMSYNLFEIQKLYYICFSLITLYTTNINSRTSSHWIYNSSRDQIIPLNDKRTNKNECHYCMYNNCDCTIDIIDEDLDGRRLMDILTYEVHKSNSKIKIDIDSTKSSAKMVSDNVYTPPKITEHPTSIKLNPDIHTSQQRSKNSNSQQTIQKSETTTSSMTTTIISCQPYVNQTQYDHLNGIHNRESFRLLPEPEVALVFAKSIKQNGGLNNNGGNIKVNLNAIEMKLITAKSKRPNSPSVYNNIGNLLRIHGESREAVECFRNALSLSPHHPDVLLNLARVLYNQNFLEDAVYLTRHSLETQPPNRNPWLQHFTLGEILQSTGHLQEAKHHFLTVINLNPGFKPAQQYLDIIERTKSNNDYIFNWASNGNILTTIYCAFVSLFLMTLVLYVVFYNIDIETDESPKINRHFNRARAIKTINRSGGSGRIKQR